MPATFECKERSIDEDMENLSKVAHWFFWRLNRTRNENTNIAELTPADVAEKQKVTRAYRELNKLNLVIRKRRQHYLCNPDVFIPRPGKYQEVYIEWNKLKHVKP